MGVLLACGVPASDPLGRGRVRLGGGRGPAEELLERGPGVQVPLHVRQQLAAGVGVVGVPLVEGLGLLPGGQGGVPAPLAGQPGGLGGPGGLQVLGQPLRGDQLILLQAPVLGDGPCVVALAAQPGGGPGEQVPVAIVGDRRGPVAAPDLSELVCGLGERAQGLEHPGQLQADVGPCGRRLHGVAELGLRPHEVAGLCAQPGELQARVDLVRVLAQRGLQELDRGVALPGGDEVPRPLHLGDAAGQEGERDGGDADPHRTARSRSISVQPSAWGASGATRTVTSRSGVRWVRAALAMSSAVIAAIRSGYFSR